MSRKVVAICPVRNEERYLPSFIDAVLFWADVLIIGDHFSTDSSKLIAQSRERVILIDAPSSNFSERERRNQLLSEARALGPGNLIVSLDADEVLEPALVSKIIDGSLSAFPLGTRFESPFRNIHPNLTDYWDGSPNLIAFIDDGSDHDHNNQIHFPRIPTGHQPPVQLDCGVLHLQYVNWDAMVHKQVWYQVWERISFPRKPAIDIYRRYHHMDSISEARLNKVPIEWKTNPLTLKMIEASLHLPQLTYWWDDDVKSMVLQNTPRKFLYTDCGASNQIIHLLISPSQQFRRRIFFWMARKTQVRDRSVDRDLLTILIYILDKTILRFLK
jgi:glycosyltransferase involved in cell wall biosynthesis